jgi:GNAT superfamily N-acetyltransferase
VEASVVTTETEERAPPESDDNEAYRFGHPPANLPSLDPPVPTRISDTGSVKLEIIDLSNRGDRSRFLDMVERICAGDPNAIVPLKMERMKFLDPKKNPSFENLEVRAILAHQAGRIVGRMTAHIDRAYDAYHGTRSGWFGFFECINERKVAHAMLADGARWLKEKGAHDMLGPFNFTSNHQIGLLVENFDRPPFVEMTYNPRYYEELLTSFGFAKAKDLYSWWIDIKAGLDNPKVARIAKIAERIKKKEGVTVRSARMKDFLGEVELIFALYNEAWQKNWGFVKVSRKEFESIVHDLKQVIVPELVIFVEFEGKPVGFACTLPNVNTIMPKNGRLFPFSWYKLLFGMKSIRQGRLFTLGVVPRYRKRGLESLLFTETVRRAKEAGFEDGEIGWTLEDNDLINRAIETMDGKLDRRYRILGLSLV